MILLPPRLTRTDPLCRYTTLCRSRRDLGAPRLFVEDSGWRDAITGAPCTLNDPGSVQAAIESGALGMGSFLTPFLHHFPRAEVRHLCQPPKAISTRDLCIRRTTVPDDLLEPDRKSTRLNSSH